MRIVIARCQVDYAGRLTAHLSLATRLIMVKSDGSVLVHSDGGSYKPLNWMSPPCTLTIGEPDDDARAEGVTEVWTVQNSKSDDRLVVGVHEILHDTSHDLGVDPGLVKDGVEAHLQRLLAENVHMFGAGWRLVRREYPTPIGPVDLLCRSESGVTVTVEVDGHDDAGPAVAVEVELDGDAGTGDGRADLTDLTDVAGASSRRASARHLAVEVKRKANIDAVEQLTRYLELLNRDPLLAPVRGMLAAQSVVPQARVLAEDRGIEVLVVDYDALRGVDDPTTRLF